MWTGEFRLFFLFFFLFFVIVARAREACSDVDLFNGLPSAQRCDTAPEVRRTETESRPAPSNWLKSLAVLSFSRPGETPRDEPLVRTSSGLSPPPSKGSMTLPEREPVKKST